MTIEDYGSRIALDARALDDLKAKAKGDPRAALKGAAQQFEAYFMQSMLKSMRDTLSQDSLFDSDQTRFYTSMFDQQLGQNLAGSGAMGLARLLEAQLSRGLPESSAAAPATATSVTPALAATPAGVATPAAPAPAPTLPAALERALGDMRAAPAPGTRQKDPAGDPLPVEAAVSAGAPATPRDFVAAVWPHALAAAEVTGLPPHLAVAHAALESGWGKSEPRRPDGSPSFNLFGVKAGKRWDGDVVEATTTEYQNGRAETRIERFRAYDSYREAFLDYANLLAASPRFAPVLAAADGTDFANSLQKSGYATDPMYAAKLARIIEGKTLRDALQG